MFNPVHYGLYFTEAHIRQAQAQRDIEPFRSAWALLRQRRQPELLPLAQSLGLLYRFEEDSESGERAVQILQQDNLTPSHNASYIEAAAVTMTQAQCFEMVRDHPVFTQQRAWMEDFEGRVSTLNQPGRDLLYVEQLWQNALNLVAAVVLEQEAAFEQAADVFKEAVRHDVHPEGYIRKAAQGQRGETLLWMLLATQALILTAEAATHAGENLWAFNERGVSALTPIPYLLYYYYYPEKWRWDSEAKGEDVPEEGQSVLETEGVRALYQRHGGFWEMAQHQHWSEDLEALLNDIRPVHDLWGGGLVTLTHGTPAPRRKRFGLF